MVQQVASESGELPEPSAEAVLIRVSISAFLEVIGRKRGSEFLKIMAEALASEERLSEILPIRPASDHEAVQKARRRALALFRAQLPVYLAKIPPA